MSTTTPADREVTLDHCRPADVTPVSVEAAALESTAPGHLRDLNREFAEENLSPVELTVEACFDEDCSLATQEQADQLREYVRAASFLGVGTLTVAIDDVANAEKVRPALAACAERAEREGLVFDLEGPITLEH